MKDKHRQDKRTQAGQGRRGRGASAQTSGRAERDYFSGNRPFETKRSAETRGDRHAGGGRSSRPSAKPAAARGGKPSSAGSPAATNERERIRQGAGSTPALKLELSSGRRKGEWWEIRLPESLAAVPTAALLKQLPFPAKLAAKWLADKSALKRGRMLAIRLFPEEAPGFPADWIDLNVLYEDDFSLVVNKPVGMEVHPSSPGQRGTLAHAVAAYYEASGQSCRVRHIHRLDKDTTGPVLYAKNELAHYEYDKAMREKKIERVYVAIAEGEFAQRKGTIDKPIGQDRHHSTRRRVSETGDPAITHYEVIDRLPGHTFVRLRLETGRTHQIRVHLSFIGHPLAGDGMYSGTRRHIHRQALHGERLIWRHPISGERLDARAPLPEDMAALLDSLRSPDHSTPSSR